MKSKNSFFITLIVVIIAVIGFFVWRQVPTKENTVGNTSAPQAFSPPVYVSGESPTLLTRPLYIQGVPKEGLTSLTARQQKDIDDFKKKIITRVMSNSPLHSSEKTVLAISISTTTKPTIGSMVVADQALLRFSSEELRLISEALKN